MALRREEVISAALELLDEAGLDALSTRRLAQRLGVQPGALYWHVANKQELLSAVADRILGEVADAQLPTGGPWQEQLLDLATAIRSALLRHREAARLVATVPPTPGPNSSMRIAERMLDILRTAGFPLATAAYGSDALLSYITGFTLQEQAGEPRPQDGEKASALSTELRTAGFPNMADWVVEWSDDRVGPFLAGLDLFVRGLQGVRHPEEAAAR
ncbi:TetR/AcrR family transcriptional regulator C-terminal domain-containing protein [Streptomyces sp. TLI_171]|uniref:TetR/AcrR family transcriptional regulator C-terminal domain-containing protein n=1 Tax=Streptomyces sp. TLI_171 TaxID=1938859 RepID=UPI000C193F3E|nr:TetR/AcrR family transcriptional regulator C-terminal domain-containing protein [Streptomyces sp. TLI_171]RKE21288.1 TetR family transcriptional regulator [Streptomyces sp. TLI_171]